MMNAVRVVFLLLSPLVFSSFAFAADKKCGGCCAGEKPNAASVKFKEALDLADAVQAVPTFSKDGKAVTAIFRNLEVAVGGVKHGPLVDRRATIVLIPLQKNEKGTCIHQDIRGHVQVDKGARAVLFVQAAGKSTLVDLCKAACGDGKYTQSVDARIPANVTTYKATLFLLVERDSDDPDIGAHLTVDSLDLELSASKP